MRFAARLTGVLLLTVGLAACDTEEVLQLASQNATVSVRALGVDAHYYDIWQAWEDSDNDGVEDPGTTPFLWCRAVRNQQTQVFLTTSVRAAPWRHSFRVSILRAGETAFEQITDDAFLMTNSNFTPFDDKVFSQMTAPPPNPIMITDMTDPMNPVVRTWKFRTYRQEQWTRLHPEVVQATRDVNIPNQLLPGTYDYGNGLCSTAGPDAVMAAQIAPLLLGAAPPFSFDIGKGDTVKIEGTKHVDALPGLNMGQAAISADIFLDGISINNFVTGTRGTGLQPGEGFSFTYTSR